MKNLRIIKIYTIYPIGYKQMQINVKKVPPHTFYCYFLDPIVINEFKSLGFKVNLKNGKEDFFLNGALNFEIVTSVWNSILEKIDMPDIELMIEDF